MIVKMTPMDRGSRDSYWNATREQLQAVKRRGDAVMLGIAGALVLLALLIRDRYSSFDLWVATASGVTLGVIGTVWFVVRRTRSIAAARGMSCASCQYQPHDTEIGEVLSSRRCPRCQAEL